MTDAEKMHLAVRLPATLVNQIDSIAEATQHDRDWVVQRALSQYLQREGAEILAEADGIAQLEKGQGIDLDRVLVKAEEIVRRAETRRAVKVG